MRWSIESRVPFLDLHWLKTRWHYLPSQKLQGRQNQNCVQAVGAGYFACDEKRQKKDKIGFGTPVDEFFRREKIVNYCKNVIYSDSYKQRPYWDWNKAEKMFNAHIQGKGNFGKEIWKWINFGNMAQAIFWIRFCKILAGTI
jgi:asparagine synthase (glutamine-hydrolysing)